MDRGVVRATQNSGADLTGSPRAPEPTSLVALPSEPSSGRFSGQTRTMAASEGDSEVWNDRSGFVGDDGWLLVAYSKPCARAPLPLLSCLSWTLSRVYGPPVAALEPNLGRQDPKLSVLRWMSRMSIPADDQCPRKRNRTIPAWTINGIPVQSELCRICACHSCCSLSDRGM
ncbi:hypothetical protein CEP51_008972 [Fusarium floridanum]|uniref:Uncharacterized protein n=2 Tax=Fusarium solani species complex TaxID=232080 RepID=A0A428RJ52_9HYPO|nr:hypothetical protein CEP51_008972 [Fusarium floridanum]RSM06638.1 hypothetical protein CDV31_008985 [Fusarium ambrosium]